MPEINESVEWTGYEADPDTEKLVREVYGYLNKDSLSTSEPVGHSSTELSKKTKIALAFLGSAATGGVIVGAGYLFARYIAENFWNSGNIVF